MNTHIPRTDTEQHNRDSWPRRRSPLPAAILYGTPPRRRKGLASLSPKPSISSLDTSIATLFLENSSVNSSISDNNSTSNNSTSCANDFWETETISSASGSPMLGSLTVGTPTSDYGDEHILSLQVKQQKRTISELSKQLELREAEIADYLQQISGLKASVEEARKRAHTDKQTVAQYEEQIRWHEEQLRLQHDEVNRLKRFHQVAEVQAERRHESALDRLTHKLKSAESETAKLAHRIKELSSELDATRASKTHESDARKLLSERLLDARVAASQATEFAAALLSKLEERKRYVTELERQVRSLRAAAAVRGHAGADGSRAVALVPSMAVAQVGQSLYAEILKATQSGSKKRKQGRGAPDQPSQPFAPPLPALDGCSPTTAAAAESLAEGAGSLLPAQYAGIEDSSSQPALQCLADNDELLDAEIAAQPVQTDIAYWMAVYAHLIWALYVRLWLRPVWSLISTMLSAVLSYLVFKPLERLMPRCLRALIKGNNQRPGNERLLSTDSM
ncbi:hypothetical protein GGI12_002875 [Dipsacomyces acuminosporus]|nr:hypothetical protein GGI12_002875 [Dipsacomyces acuminosporus]